MKRYPVTIMVFVAAMVLSLFAGCGGGGSGGGSSGGAVYSGLTTPAVLTEDNAQMFLEGAYAGGIVGSGIVSPVSAVDVHGISETRTVSMQRLALLVKDLVEEAAARTDDPVPPHASAIQTEPINEAGECGGTVSGYIRVDDVTGSMTGSLTFSDYCEEGSLMSGTLSLSGEMDLESGAFSMIMTFTDITEVSEDEGIDYVLNGTVAYDSSQVFGAMTMDMCLLDNMTGESYLLEDYTLTIIEHDYYSEVALSGRFYCSDYGYAVLYTEEAVIISDYDDYPMQGVYVASGAGGTSARLTFLSSAAYLIEVDEDGDGDYECNSGVLYWEE